MLRKTKFFILFFLGLLSVTAQFPGTSVMPLKETRNIFGGTQNDRANSVAKTSDGGYIIAGSSLSNDGDVSGNHGNTDFWVLKFSSSGTLQWQKMLGGTSNDVAYSITQTNDNGYIVAGSSSSNNGDTSGYHGGISGDIWVVKLNNSGIIQWQKMLGGTSDDSVSSIIQTADGGYAIAGQTLSSDGDVSGRKGGYDFWVVKLTNAGVLQWQKTFGGADNDQAASIIQTNDGGYAVAGSALSNDGDVSGNHGSFDSWIIKLNNSGTLQWQRTLGGTLAENANSIIQTADGGYAVAGYSGSNNGDVSVNNGNTDFWILKLTNTGNLEWQKSVGGTSVDRASAIIHTPDNGYMITGFTRSNNGDLSGNHGNTDFA